MDGLVRQRGMTLVEVMVASAILALVMLAVIVTASHSERSGVRLMKKTQASWVANNLDAQLRAGLHGKITPTGSFVGHAPQGEQNWYWEARAEELNEEVILITITVHEDESKPALVTTQTAVWSPS